MTLVYRKGDLIRLTVPTTSGWQGIGVVLEPVHQDDDLDTVVPFRKQGEDDDATPCIALLSEVEPVAQRHPTPVPVSERLPGPEDCDGEGMCWAWRSFDPEEDDSGDCWMTIPCEWLEGSERWTYWLPATALPLPAGEVE